MQTGPWRTAELGQETSSFGEKDVLAIQKLTQQSTAQVLVLGGRC